MDTTDGKLCVSESAIMGHCILWGFCAVNIDMHVLILVSRARFMSSFWLEGLQRQLVHASMLAHFFDKHPLGRVRLMGLNVSSMKSL